MDDKNIEIITFKRAVEEGMFMGYYFTSDKSFEGEESQLFKLVNSRRIKIDRRQVLQRVGEKKAKVTYLISRENMAEALLAIFNNPDVIKESGSMTISYW